MKAAEAKVLQAIKEETNAFNIQMELEITEFYRNGGYKPIYRMNEPLSMSLEHLSFNESIYQDLITGPMTRLFEPTRFFDELYRCVEQYDKYKEKPLRWISYCNSLKLTTKQGDYLCRRLSDLQVKLDRASIGTIEAIKPETNHSTELEDVYAPILMDEQLLRLYKLCNIEDMFAIPFKSICFLECFDLNANNCKHPKFKRGSQIKFIYILSKIEAMNDQLALARFGISNYKGQKSRAKGINKPNLVFTNSVDSIINS